jgi:hypothetical protein
MIQYNEYKVKYIRYLTTVKDVEVDPEAPDLDREGQFAFPGNC